MKILLLLLLGQIMIITRAEEMKFKYTLNSNGNICFMQNVAEKINSNNIRV